MLKFPPVEDVHILISMGLSYQEKINGKGSNKIIGFENTSPAKIIKPAERSYEPGLEKNEVVEQKKEIVFNPLTSEPKKDITPKSQNKELLFNPLIPEPKKDITPKSQNKELLFNPLVSEPKRDTTPNSQVKEVVFDPLAIKPQEKKTDKPIEVLPKLSQKDPETTKEETKTLAVRNENSLVEKCNTALLLLLEQSDE